MKRLSTVLMFLLVSSAAHAAGSEIYPWPSDWSPGGLSSWSQPLVASFPQSMYYDAATNPWGCPPTWTASVGDICIVHSGYPEGAWLWLRQDLYNAGNLATWTWIGGGGRKQGLTENINFPYEYGVSTVTLYFEEGLYIGHTGP